MKLSQPLQSVDAITEQQDEGIVIPLDGISNAAPTAPLPTVTIPIPSAASPVSTEPIKQARRCPRCRSTNIDRAYITNRAMTLLRFTRWRRYYCHSCGRKFLARKSS